MCPWLVVGEVLGCDAVMLGGVERWRDGESRTDVTEWAGVGKYIGMGERTGGTNIFGRPHGINCRHPLVGRKQAWPMNSRPSGQSYGQELLVS